MYLRELEEGSLERATIMDRVASRALQVGAWACGKGGQRAMPQATRTGSWGGQGSRLADTPPQAANPLSLLPHPKPCPA